MIRWICNVKIEQKHSNSKKTPGQTAGWKDGDMLFHRTIQVIA